MHYHYTILIATILLLLLIACGCGIYSFTGGGIPGVKTVYVPIFSNATTEFGLEQELTDAVVNALNSNAQLSYAESKNADAVLEGKITNFNDGLLSFTANEEITEYSVRVSVQVKFERVKDGKIILEETFTASQEYESATPDDRQKAIETALKKIAEDIINKAFSGW